MTNRTPNNLPAQSTVFVGHEREIELVRALLWQQDVRLLTLVGAPGIGKTRLGIEVATGLLEDFADGVFFIALAPVTSPSLVASTIARTLGIQETGSQPVREKLKEYLHDRQILLVLDNFEHLLDAASLVSELLEASPRLKVLVTSRELLRLEREMEFTIPPLALPDSNNLTNIESQALLDYAAVRLFVDRAMDVKHDFTLTAENGHTIAQICCSLDGLPLAIELAAVRIKVLSPNELLERSESWLTLLTGGARDLLTHQRTLRSAIEWSYNLLDEEEKALYRRLGIFVNGCSIEAAQAVCNAGGDLPWDILDGVTSLSSKSLIRKSEQMNAASRFGMLETLREYALERLEESGEIKTVRQLHADCYLRLAERVRPELEGSKRAFWLDQLEMEHDNLRAVLRWFEEEGEPAAEMELRMTAALWYFWWSRGHLSEGSRWLDAALSTSSRSAGATTATSARAQALYGASRFATSHDDYPRARTLLEESLLISRLLDYKQGIADSLSGLSWVAFCLGDNQQATTLGEESLGLFRELGDKSGTTLVLGGLAYAAWEAGNIERAKVLFAEGLQFARELGSKGAIAGSLTNLGEIARGQGNYEAARLLYEESLVTFREGKLKGGIAAVLACLGSVANHQGNYDDAEAILREGLILCKELGNKYTMAFCEVGLAGVWSARNEPEKAARLLGAANALLEAIGIQLQPADRADYDHNMAATRGQLAEETFAEAWAEGQAMTMEQAIAYALEES